MITVPDYLEQPFKDIAEQQQQSVDALLAQLIEEYLEDYRDIQLAEQALERIERGESELLSLDEAEQLLNELASQN